MSQAAFVEVETVTEDDDDDSSSTGTTSTDFDHVVARGDGFDDEDLFVVSGYGGSNNNNTPAASATSGNSNNIDRTKRTTAPTTSAPSSFLPDPDEWLNVVNTAADTFMAANRRNGADASDSFVASDDQHSSSNYLLPHPDELKVDNTINGNNSTNNMNAAAAIGNSSSTRPGTLYDEPDHNTPFVRRVVDDGDAAACSLPHPDDDPNAMAVNSTSHGASLPHVDEVKTTNNNTRTGGMKKTNSMNVDDVLDNHDEPDHLGIFQANLVGVDSLPTNPDDVRHQGANHGFHVNSTSAEASLPHADEVKVNVNVNANPTRTNKNGQTGVDEPDHTGGGWWSINASSPDDYSASLMHPEELKAQQQQQRYTKQNRDDNSWTDDDDDDALEVDGEEPSLCPDGEDDDDVERAAGNGMVHILAENSRRPSFGSEVMIHQQDFVEFVPNLMAVDSLPQPGDAKDGTTLQVNSTGHGASLMHPDEYKAEQQQRTSSSGNKTKKKKNKTSKRTSKKNKSDNGVNLTILDYDSDEDQAEKIAARKKATSVDYDEPDHDTPHTVQSTDHGASLPHPMEIHTDNVNQGGGVGAIASKFFSSIVRVNSKEEDYVNAVEGITSNNDLDDEEGAEAPVVLGIPEKKRKQKNGKKSKKDKRQKKKRSISEDHIDDDRFSDEPGSNAAIVLKGRNGNFTIDSDDSEDSDGDLESANYRSSVPSQADGVFRKNTRSSADISKHAIRSSSDTKSRSLFPSYRGISYRLGLESNHSTTHRMDDEEEVQFGLSLDDNDDDDDSFYLKRNAKKHYRASMFMRHKNVCIIVSLIIVFLIMLISLAVLSSQKRKSSSSLNGGGSSTPSPPSQAALAAPTFAPTLPPVAESCVNSISLAAEISDRECFGPDEFINITFTQCYPERNDWIGLFPSGALYFGRLWREYVNWIWACGVNQCTEQQVTEDLPIRGKFSTPMLDPGDYQLFIVLDSGWPYLPLVSSEVIRVRPWCSIADESPVSPPVNSPVSAPNGEDVVDGIRNRQLQRVKQTIEEKDRVTQ